jgi:hypothetical protein
MDELRQAIINSYVMSNEGVILDAIALAAVEDTPLDLPDLPDFVTNGDVLAAYLRLTGQQSPEIEIPEATEIEIPEIEIPEIEIPEATEIPNGTYLGTLDDGDTGIPMAEEVEDDISGDQLPPEALIALFGRRRKSKKRKSKKRKSKKRKSKKRKSKKRKSKKRSVKKKRKSKKRSIQNRY